MFDELWSEIQDMPGEIFDMDIPELRDDNKFDVEEYIKGDTDYWHLEWTVEELSHKMSTVLKMPYCSLKSNNTTSWPLHFQW